MRGGLSYEVEGSGNSSNMRGRDFGGLSGGNGRTPFSIQGRGRSTGEGISM